MKHRYRIIFEATPETTYEIEADDMEEAYRKAKTTWMKNVIKEKIDRLPSEVAEEIFTDFYELLEGYHPSYVRSRLFVSKLADLKAKYLK